MDALKGIYITPYSSRTAGKPFQELMHFWKPNSTKLIKSVTSMQRQSEQKPKGNKNIMDNSKGTETLDAHSPQENRAAFDIQ